MSETFTIQDLVESLNENSTGMRTAKVKAKYPKKMLFFGKDKDTKAILPQITIPKAGDYVEIEVTKVPDKKKPDEFYLFVNSCKILASKEKLSQEVQKDGGLAFNPGEPEYNELNPPPEPGTTTEKPADKPDRAYWDAKDRSIVRQTCIKAVAEIYAGSINLGINIEEASKDMLALAETFEKWVYRK